MPANNLIATGLVNGCFFSGELYLAFSFSEPRYIKKMTVFSRSAGQCTFCALNSEGSMTIV